MGARGNLFIVSAPSGCGKTSLVRALLERLERIEVSVSHTTRARRDGEIDGKDYFFVDETGFDRMVAEGAFLEHAVVFDRRYGTSREAVEQRLAAGIDVVLEIDWQGARLVQEGGVDAVTLFILPPSLAALEQRLRDRGDDSEMIARRMRDAVSEISHHDEYRYLLFNDSFERAVADLVAVVTSTRLQQPLQQARHHATLAALLAG